MKEAHASLVISVDLECPHCEENIDLMDLGELTEEGEMQSAIFTNDGWGIDNWNREILCPTCYQDIKITEVLW